jgi:transposase
MESLIRTEAEEVLTLDDYLAIRRTHRDGMPIKQIAREFGHSGNTIRKILKHAHPGPLPATRASWAPVLGPFHAIIDQILVDDEDAPPKQRHTAAQIYRRLRDDHGYRGVYAQVQRYVRAHRRRDRETFVPLGHLPGQRLETDFGHIDVDFPGCRTLVPFYVATWAYSNAPFALPLERTEAVLEGMVAAFEFFGAVPKEACFDYVPGNIIVADPSGDAAEESEGADVPLKEGLGALAGNAQTKMASEYSRVITNSATVAVWPSSVISAWPKST